MDNLKEILEERFSDTDLPIGHEVRFSSKLKKKQKSKRNYTNFIGYGIAASLLLMIGFFIGNENNLRKREESIAIISPFFEDEARQLKIQIEGVKVQMVKCETSKIKTELKDVFNQLKFLDKEYQTLTEQWQQQVQTPQILEAMMLNLEQQLLIANQTLNHLKQLKFKNI